MSCAAAHYRGHLMIAPKQLKLRGLCSSFCGLYWPKRNKKNNQLELLTATARIRCDSNYASLTRRAIIIFDHPLCLNHSMCWAAAHHLRRRQSGWDSHHRLSKCGMQFVFHPWLFQLVLTTHIHPLSRHTVAAGSGWCTLLTGAGCQ